MPTRFGALAQLGERYNGIVEVRSSILLGSTKPTSVQSSQTGSILGLCPLFRAHRFRKKQPNLPEKPSGAGGCVVEAGLEFAVFAPTDRDLVPIAQEASIGAALFLDVHDMGQTHPMGAMAVYAVKVRELLDALAKLLGQQTTALSSDHLDVVVLCMHADDVVSKIKRHGRDQAS